MKKENLDAVVTFRLPKKLKEQWIEQSKEHGLCLGDYIRAIISDNDKTIIRNKRTPRKMPQIKRDTADPLLVQAVARCGNNLNQIARAINQGNKENINIHLELCEIKDELLKHVS